MRAPDWSFAADLLFPPRCPFCGQVIRHGEQTCPTCAQLKPSAIRRELPQPGGEGLLCFAAYPYTGKARKAVLRMKFEGEAPIAGFLGRQLAQSLQAELSQSFLPDVVTVVPMTKLHRLRRGYNQSERIARAAAKALGLPYQSLLCKRKHNRVQHKLSEKERFQNVQGVFAALPQAGGLRILLVDDIVTTGATLAACQTALFSAGAAEVLCAAAAMTLPSNEAGKNKH